MVAYANELYQSEACLPKGVHKQVAAPLRVLRGLEGHWSIMFSSTPHSKTYNALEEVSVGQNFVHAAGKILRKL